MVFVLPVTGSQISMGAVYIADNPSWTPTPGTATMSALLGKNIQLKGTLVPEYAPSDGNPTTNVKLSGTFGDLTSLYTYYGGL